MFLGYNTNGFAHHRLEDAIEIIAELGYKGIAITPDVHNSSYERHLPLSRLGGFRTGLNRAELRSVVETGARFMLDSRRKHQPTLLNVEETERRYRYHFLEACIDIAEQLHSDSVSFWSGTPTDEAPDNERMSRLVEQCHRLSEYAAAKNVRLAFEPEPGMFIDTMDKFAELHARVNHPNFGLTIDVGHLVCNGELPVSKYLKEWRHVLWNVHIEDMKRGVHDHLMFGEGEVDFADVFAGLREANYQGGVYVELSRHSYDAVNVARKAKEFLDPFIQAK